jgi:hypothetical protein
MNDQQVAIDEGVGTGIPWRHDIDQALQDARSQHKPVILDFSAAPM